MKKTITHVRTRYFRWLMLTHIKKCVFFAIFFFSWTADFPFYATNLKIEVAAKKKNSNSSNSALESPLYIRLLWNDKAITLPRCDVWCPIEDAMEILQSGYIGEEFLTDTLNSYKNIWIRLIISLHKNVTLLRHKCTLIGKYINCNKIKWKKQ